MKLTLASALRLVVLSALLLVAFGCKSEEEKANEAAIQSRNNQAAAMGGHAGAPSGPPPGTAPATK